MSVVTGVIIIEGHVQGLSNTRSLGEVGIPVYVIDKDICLAKFSKYCNKYFQCPDYKSDEFISFLIDLAISEHLQGWVLLPSNDHIVYNLSKNKETISKYYKTIVPDLDTLNNIVNKRNLLRIAQKCATPIPITYYIDNIHEGRDNLRFPVLLKGIEGLSFYKSMHTKVIHIETLEKLDEELPKLLLKVDGEKIMIQELIPFNSSHKVISFTAFCVNGKIEAHWIGAKLREHPIMCGTATLSQSIENEQCYQLSVTLLANLAYTGVCEIEYLYDPRDRSYKLIEINPRTWLWVGLAKACGVNYALILYNYLNQLPYDYPNSYDIGKKWINYLTDTFFSLGAIMMGKLTISQYVRQLHGEKVNAVFSWKDYLPGIIFPFLGFYIAKKRR